MRSDFPTASRARVRGLRHARAAVDKSSTASYTEIRTLPRLWILPANSTARGPAVTELACLERDGHIRWYAFRFGPPDELVAHCVHCPARIIV